jgi:hypothetical protein
MEIIRDNGVSLCRPCFNGGSRRLVVLDLPRFRGRVVFQMPSVFLSLDDAPFGFDLSMRGLTPQAPEALRFSNARKNPIALEAL